MTNELAPLAAARVQMRLWGAAFVAGTFGVAAIAFFLDIAPVLVVFLFLSALLLLIPFVRAVRFISN